MKIVIRRLIQLLCKENDDWTVELSRSHDRSTVHRKLTQLQIITQIENFRLNEGESKEKRAANPESLQSERKSLSSMHELLKTLLPSGTPCAWCACDGFVDNGRANITADYILFFQINVLTCGFFLLSAVQLAWFHNYCVH